MSRPRTVFTGLLALAFLFGCTSNDRETAPAEASAEQRAEEAAEEGASTEGAEAAAEPGDAKSQLLARLAGDWRMDLGSLEQDPQFAKLPPQQRMQALAMARQMMADVSFSFSDDGRVRLGFGPTGRAGTYTVDKVEGNALHVTTTTKGPDGETVEKAILRIEGDAMWVTEGKDGRTIRLLRGKPEKPTSQPTGQPASQPTGNLPPGHPAPGSQPARAPGSQPARALPPGHPPPGGQRAPASQPKMPAPQPAR